MSNTIKATVFDTVKTIVFHNHSTNQKNIVWVCEDRYAFSAAIERLENNEHIEIVAKANSHVERY
jgi:hypothetical protein